MYSFEMFPIKIIALKICYWWVNKKRLGPRETKFWKFDNASIEVLRLESTIKEVELDWTELSSFKMQTGPSHSYPCSILHSFEQPSRFSKLLSSHSSDLIKTPSPHQRTSI